MEPNVTTLIAERDGLPAARPRLQLVVVGPGVVATHAVPEEGELLVGRGEGAQVRVADAFASRQHARLVAEGGRHYVEDLGSANGTRIRQASIPPGHRVEIEVGETIELGSTILVLKPATPVEGAWPMQTPRSFEAELEAALAQTAAAGRVATVARLRVIEGFLGERIAEIAHAVLKPGDLLGAYGPAEYALLLGGTEVGVARTRLGRLEAALRADGTRAITAAVGYPIDGRDGATLLARAADALAAEGGRAPGGLAVVVQDPRMRKLYELAQLAAGGTLTVLVLGETGVGKDVMAHMVHRLSPRADKPFLRIDCAALSSGLLESELFGYERGAFTGAAQAKPGLIESAPGGTVFLDEIGELPLALQAKLLCVLETREVTRVGGLKGRPVDVRFVAATNRDLEQEVAAGRFRKDLYFRLNGFSLFVPPLRERRGEIPFLARALTGQICERLDRPTQPALSAAAVAALELHPWPGNVRELRNVMERAVLLCRGEEILPEHLLFETAGAEPLPTSEPAPASPASAAPVAAPAPAPIATPAETAPAPAPERRDPAIVDPVNAPTIRAFGPRRDLVEEKRRIEEALAACAGNQSRAAKLLGMPRSTFVLRLDEFGISRPRKKE
jgi:DNA-binding NtrC family response regulator/pSer/pThr/pTyr-binding forkhead associated (FHA) protein